MSTRNKEPSVRPKKLTIRKQETAGEALDRKSITYCDKNGIINSCSALNTRFCPTIIFKKYEALRIVRDNDRLEREEIAKWLGVTSQFEASLLAFLQLPYHKFWVIVHSEISVQVALDSYLRNGPRFYDFEAMAALQTDQMKHLANSVHALVLKVLLRMTTERESERDFLSSQALTAMLSKSFDFPKLIDILSLYWSTAGIETRQTLCDLVRRVIEGNAKHDSQLTDLASGMMHLLDLIREKLFLDDEIVPSNHKSKGASSQLKTMEWTRLQEIISSVTDIAVSLSCLLEAFPAASQCFHDSSFESAFISFYEIVFPVLQQELDHRFNQDPSSSHSTTRQVMTARSYVIHCCRQVIHYSSIRPLLDPTVDLGMKPILIDSLLDVVTLILSNKYFAKDYCSKYPLSVDMEQLMSNSSLTGFSDVDETRIDYLLRECRSIEMLKSADSSSSFAIPVNGSSSNKNNSQGSTITVPAPAAHQPRTRKTKKKKKSPPDVETEQTSSTSAGGGVQEVELLSLITGVKDILPDFGEGYIEACLEKFAFNQELTLNALLTNDLPIEIKSIDTKLTREEKNRLAKSTAAVPDVIASRSNIFDGDEFDIHRNESIDLTRVHVGKKDRTIDAVPDTELRKRTILLQEEIQMGEEEEELALLAEMGITDPADLYVG